MNISILTLFPQLYEPFLQASLIGRAEQAGTIKTSLVNLFDQVAPKKRIDSPVVGPGTGMLIKPEVIEHAVNTQEAAYGKAYKIFFSPQGKKMTQPLLREVAQTVAAQKHVMLIASRYEGMDARVEHEYADLVLSLGDFVLMGGDIPAMALLEGMLRLIPGVVGKSESVEQDSFTGPFVDYPEYTLPVEWHGMRIPEVLQSGNHAAIEQWRTEKAAQKTVLQHFQWLRSWDLTAQQKKLSRAFIPHHYTVLMHDQVALKDGRIGTTSVTTMDIHDIARSSRTYDIENFFLVTPLIDQQKIVQSLFDFWLSSDGKAYNAHRYEAIERVRMAASLEAVIQEIEQKEGKKPIVIATSAQHQKNVPIINYCDQTLVWAQERPVVVIFGTGHGLSDQLLNQCDYILKPIEGFSEFNHLSVRSAVGIVLDRWLGINPLYS